MNSQWVGGVNSEVEIELTVIDVKPYDFPDGKGEILKFLDDKKRVLIWMTRKNWGLGVGQNFRVRATISRHAMYKGEAQTYIKDLVPLDESEIQAKERATLPLGLNKPLINIVYE